MKLVLIKDSERPNQIHSILNRPAVQLWELDKKIQKSKYSDKIQSSWYYQNLKIPKNFEAELDGYRAVYSQWYIRNINFSKELYENIINRSYTPKEILAIPNQEQKSITIEYYGYENIIPTFEKEGQAVCIDISKKRYLNPFYSANRLIDTKYSRQGDLRITKTNLNKIPEGWKPKVGPSVSATGAIDSTLELFNNTKDQWLEIENELWLIKSMYEVKGRSIDAKFIRCRDTSKPNAWYFIPVKPSINNANEAVASTLGLSREEYERELQVET